MFGSTDAELQAACLLNKLYNETIPKGELRRRWFQLLAQEQADGHPREVTPTRLGRFFRRIGRSQEQTAAGLPGELAM